MTWTPLGPFFNQGGMAGGNQVWAAFGAPSGADERLAACGVAGRTVAGGRMPHSHAEPGRVWQAGRARPPWHGSRLGPQCQAPLLLSPDPTHSIPALPSWVTAFWICESQRGQGGSPEGPR